MVPAYHRNSLSSSLTIDVGDQFSFSDPSIVNIQLMCRSKHGSEHVLGSFKGEEKFFYNPNIPNDILSIENDRVCLNNLDRNTFPYSGKYEVWIKINFKNKGVILSDPCTLDVV